MLTFTGSALFIATFTIASFVVPVIAVDARGGALLDPAGRLFSGPLDLIFLLVALGFAVGQMLPGFATTRAGVLPRTTGVLLLVGAPIEGAPPSRASRALRHRRDPLQHSEERSALPLL